MSKSRTEKAMPYVERFFDNEYARRNLRDAASAIGDAYSRGAKKGRRAPADRKFRDRVADATLALRESADAFQNDRRRPRGQLAKRALTGLLLVGAAAGIAIAASEDLREMVLGSDAPGPDEPVAAEPAVTPPAAQVG